MYVCLLTMPTLAKDLPVNLAVVPVADFDFLLDLAAWKGGQHKSVSHSSASQSGAELCTHRLCRDDFVLADRDASRVLEVLVCELANFGRPSGGEPESYQLTSGVTCGRSSRFATLT